MPDFCLKLCLSKVSSFEGLIARPHQMLVTPMNDLQRGVVRYLQQKRFSCWFPSTLHHFCMKTTTIKTLDRIHHPPVAAFWLLPSRFFKVASTRPTQKAWAMENHHPFLMVRTRKDEDFHGRTVSFREGMPCMPILDLEQR